MKNLFKALRKNAAIRGMKISEYLVFLIQNDTEKIVEELKGQ